MSREACSFLTYILISLLSILLLVVFTISAVMTLQLDGPHRTAGINAGYIMLHVVWLIFIFWLSAILADNKGKLTTLIYELINKED